MKKLTIIILFLILAIKTAGKRQLTFDHVKQGAWAVITRPLVYSLLAGIFLAIYLITWQGALLFVFIIYGQFSPLLVRLMGAAMSNAP